MARIETYTAQRALQPGNTPSVQLSTAVSQEVSNLGGAVSNFAAQLKQRQEQRENFKAENDYRRMKLELDEQMRVRATEAPEDGTGLHENFMVQDFKPKRDEFLGGLPERLRPQFQTLLDDEQGSDAFEWSTRSATAERDINYNWQRTEITATQEQLATAISMNPDAYDALLLDGKSLIEASSLPTPEKAKLLDDWERMAQVSILNRMLETDPQGVLRELGVDTRQLSMSTQFDMLSRAVQWQESRDNPNAVSAKGAVGLMQVMPGTAAEIAQKLGDENFPTGAPENVIRAYLSNPYVNKRYGEAYLRENLKRFANTRNPIETALVAYNAGPSVAEKWVESGYDDKMLPKETRDYKKKVMGEMLAPAGKGDPGSVKFVGADTSTVNPDLTARVADAFASIGLEKVKINSGSRSETENKAAGGATKSQHLDDNALDIDVSGMSIPDRIELIKSLSAAGVTGLGIGSNIIHADLGGRRAWGYATSAGGGDVPKWAAPTIAEHLAGTTPPVRRVAGRYGKLPYDVRQQFTTKADQLITQTATATAKSTAAEKVQVNMARENELALIRKTGQGDPNFDEGSISTVLGEDDYLKFANDRDIARRSYTAIQGVGEMTDEDMEGRLAEYEPTAGSTFANQQEVYAALDKEVQRVRRLRATKPDEAAAEFAEVRGAYEAMIGENGEARDPVAVQSFVRSMLDAQTRVGIPSKAQAPIDSGWARRIAQSLLAFPLTEDADGDPTTPVTRVNAMAKMADVYDGLYTLFGDYTDEVLVYAVSEYKGVDKVVADALVGAMAQINRGGDPFARYRNPSTVVDTAVDIGQSSNWLRDAFQFGPGARDVVGLPNAAPPPLPPVSGGGDGGLPLAGDLDGDGVLSGEEQARLNEEIQ